MENIIAELVMVFEACDLEEEKSIGLAMSISNVQDLSFIRKPITLLKLRLISKQISLFK